MFCLVVMLFSGCGVVVAVVAVVVVVAATPAVAFSFDAVRSF